jgi:hypothetical protein
MPYEANHQGGVKEYHATEADLLGLASCERLNRWAVVRLLPNMQRTVIARFRHRSDADGHLLFLQQHDADGNYVVLFDP